MGACFGVAGQICIIIVIVIIVITWLEFGTGDRRQRATAGWKFEKLKKPHARRKKNKRVSCIVNGKYSTEIYIYIDIL